MCSPPSASCAGGRRASSTSCRVLRGDHVGAHVGAQHLGQADAPVGALVGLEHGDQHTREREARAVERVHQLGARARRGAVADARTARLEVAEVRARAHLEPLARARRPHLDVVLHGSDEGEVAGAHLHDAVREAEPAAHVLGVVEQTRQLCVRGLRPHELHQLDLVELVPALDAAHVAPRRHLLAPEAGRVGHVADRQPLRLQHLVAVEVGDRHLGRGDEPQVLLGVAVEVVAELGEVPGADQALALHHRRRVDLDVAVLARVEVEHPGDERALEARARAAQHVEARAGDLDAALEVDDAELRPQVPVRERREIEAARLAHAAHDHVRGLVGTDGHVGVRQVGHLEHAALEVRLGGSRGRLGGRDALAHCALRGDRPLALGRVLQVADRLRGVRPLGAQRLEGVEGLAPAAVGVEQRVHLGRREAHLCELGLHALRLGADQADVEHLAPHLEGRTHVLDRRRLAIEADADHVEARVALVPAPLGEEVAGDARHARLLAAVDRVERRAGGAAGGGTLPRRGGHHARGGAADRGARAPPPRARRGGAPDRRPGSHPRGVRAAQHPRHERGRAHRPGRGGPHGLPRRRGREPARLGGAPRQRARARRALLPRAEDHRVTALHALSLREAAARVRRREVSATELVRDAFARIAAVDGRVGAFLTLDEAGALATAAAVDRRVAAGEDPGPLGGVPIGVKDIICTAGLRTTAGSRILEGFVPSYDATVTARLRRAGAVIVGKLNCDEFAMGSSTENSALGTTRNPWDAARVPGGSSGGSGAAVAARECHAALGTDTGGSVRLPAAFCGVAGMKPTYGRVSRYGVVAYASSLDQVGPIAREVADVAVVLEAIAGHDPADSTASPRPVPSYAATRAAGFGAEVKRRIMLGTYALSAGYYDAYYLKAQQVRTLIRRDFQQALARCDALVTPVAPTTAFRLGEKTANPLTMYLSDIFTISVNLAGLPALALPCGFDGAGLPIGLQVIGRPFDEATVLRIGHAYEQATEWHRRSAPL